MEKKPRLGTDPLKPKKLDWIKDTRKKGKQNKQGLQGLHIKHRLKSKSSLKRGLPEGFIRATLIVKEEYLDKLKALSYWERKKITEVINEALGSYLKGRKIRPINKRGV